MTNMYNICNLSMLAISRLLPQERTVLLDFSYFDSLIFEQDPSYRSQYG